MRMLERHFAAITGKIHPQLLQELVPMEVTPAARWFLQEADKEYWDYNQDFPCVVPPAPATWLEFQMPETITSAERSVQNTTLARMGAFCITLEIEPETRQTALADDLLLRYLQAFSGTHQPPDWLGGREARHQYQREALAQGTVPRWMTVWNIMAELFTGELLTYGLFGMYLDESGRIMRGINAAIHGFSEELFAKLPDDYDIFAEALPFMFAFSLTHCKNVSTSDLTVPATVAKKRAKKGVPSLTYKVLDIRPIRRSSQAASGSPSETKRAMHFVRAHFKTFAPDKPLFGKHSGTYWWSLALRGDEEAGAVAKSYRVKPA